MDDIKKKRKRTKKELKALAEKNSTNGKMHIQSDNLPTIEPTGSRGTDELIKRDYGFDWFGNKGLHPDQYWPDR